MCLLIMHSCYICYKNRHSTAVTTATAAVAASLLLLLSVTTTAVAVNLFQLGKCTRLKWLLSIRGMENVNKCSMVRRLGDAAAGRDIVPAVTGQGVV